MKEFEAPRTFKVDAPFDHVFGTRHDVIEDQRAEFLARLREEGHDIPDAPETSGSETNATGAKTPDASTSGTKPPTGDPSTSEEEAAHA